MRQYFTSIFCILMMIQSSFAQVSYPETLNMSDECEDYFYELKAHYEDGFRNGEGTRQGLDEFYQKLSEDRAKLKKLKEALEHALNDDSRNKRRLLVGLATGAAVIVLGYLVIKGLSEEEAISWVEELLEGNSDSYIAVILGAGVIGGGSVSFSQLKNFSMSKNQLKASIEAVKKKELELNLLEAEVNQKACDYNYEIQMELGEKGCPCDEVNAFICKPLGLSW